GGRLDPRVEGPGERSDDPLPVAEDPDGEVRGPGQGDGDRQRGASAVTVRRERRRVERDTAEGAGDEEWDVDRRNPVARRLRGQPERVRDGAATAPRDRDR